MWSKRESSEEGEELMKVIDVGLQKPVLATDIIAVVLEEVIKEHHRSAIALMPCLAPPSVWIGKAFVCLNAHELRV